MGVPWQTWLERYCTLRPLFYSKASCPWPTCSFNTELLIRVCQALTIATEKSKTVATRVSYTSLKRDECYRKKCECATRSRRTTSRVLCTHRAHTCFFSSTPVHRAPLVLGWLTSWIRRVALERLKDLPEVVRFLIHGTGSSYDQPSWFTWNWVSFPWHGTSSWDKTEQLLTLSEPRVPKSISCSLPPSTSTYKIF